MNMNETQQANMMGSSFCEIHKIEKTKTDVSLPFGKTFSFYICQKCEEEKEKQEEKEKIEKEEKLLFERNNAGIPKKFFGAKVSDFKNIKTILEWLKEPKGFLFVHGKCGCGKSHLSCAIKYFFNTNNMNCSLVFSSELFLKLRNTFNNKTGNNGTEFSIIDEYAPIESSDRKYNDINLCIFDDIGAQKISEYAIEAWYDIIDRRYRNDYPTIFTSNLSLKEISICMTDRIASRLASGINFELIGNDRRLSK